VLERALAGRELSVDDATLLLGASGADLLALMQAADVARREEGRPRHLRRLPEHELHEHLLRGLLLLRLLATQGGRRRL